MSAGAHIQMGETIPPSTDHAVSVSLPTWKTNVAYEEGEPWVMGKLKTGYPRFFVHLSIVALKDRILEQFSDPRKNDAFVFPTRAAAARCREFMFAQLPGLDADPGSKDGFVLVDVRPNNRFRDLAKTENLPEDATPAVTAAVFPKEYNSVGKAFWQHTGEGVSSRRAEFVLDAFEYGLVDGSVADPGPAPGPDSKPDDPATWKTKGPRRYKGADGSGTEPTTPAAPARPNRLGVDQDLYVEERFGRNLTLSDANGAKEALRKRIAEVANGESGSDAPTSVSPQDVFLYPAGMNAIFQAHQSLLQIDPSLKSIDFGFPYIDTLKLLQKFGPGCLFYGRGADDDLDDLESRLRAGERYLALFCEFPSNPLLKSPNLARIRQLADAYGFFVVVDETIGNFFNVHLLDHADVLVSSLTKVFSGDSNVMGGSAVINPKSPRYADLRAVWAASYRDTYWGEDAIFMERNSRDFSFRAGQINVNAEAICDLLRAHPAVKEVYYPKLSPTRPYYDHCRRPSGGYGGLLSCTFHHPRSAIAFFDAIESAKGPSLGTNFTLTSPYVILAHYGELDWAAQFGVDAHLIRFSVGLEPTHELLARFKLALEIMQAAPAAP